jgi:peptidoglycan/xylan/chitin deacetylase (PgdA/CDA1 family)
MALRKLKGMGHGALAALRQTSGILMYHRVATEPADPWNLCVTPASFAEQMEVLSRQARCIPLAEFARHWSVSRGRVRCAVTFDDGYRDNLLHALPILERFGIPATLFIVSARVGSEREFWWDTLERCVLEPAVLPASLEMEIDGQRRVWGLASTGRPAGDWRADDDEPREPRQLLFLELWNLLVGMDEEVREGAMRQLVEWAGIRAVPESPERLPLSREELFELARHPLITIGCHTAQHAALTRLPSGERQRQVLEGRAQLQAWTGRTVDTFSYPYGMHDPETRRLVRSSAFSLACTSRPAVVTPLAGRWMLPRLQAMNLDGEQFSRWLRGWFPQWAA